MQLLIQMTPDQELVAAAEGGIPPSRFVAQGVARRKGRAITSNEAMTLAMRGVPGCLLSFGDCGFLTAPELREALAALRCEEGDETNEMDLRIYGRRKSARLDTRLLVLCVASDVHAVVVS